MDTRNGHFRSTTSYTLGLRYLGIGVLMDTLSSSGRQVRDLLPEIRYLPSPRYTTIKPLASHVSDSEITNR